MSEGARITGLEGKGPDGARYGATTPDGRRVRLHALRPDLDRDRVADIKNRIGILRAVDVPELAPVLDARLEGDRRVVVVGVDALPTLEEHLASHGGRAGERAAAIALGLLKAVRRAHKLGLPHGSLRASQLLIRHDGLVVFDLCGIRSADDDDARTASLEDDVGQLAELLRGLLASFTLDEEATNVLAAAADPDPAVRPPIGLIARVLTPALMDAVTNVEESPRPPRLGDALGRFKLLELLGKGGNGEVYRAEPIGGGVPVAIKVLKADAAGDEVKLLRFRREARVLGELRHPNLANLVEVNEDRGVLFIATELVVGQSLEVYRRSKGKLPEAEAIKICVEIAKALVAAHERGIVHRDVKPENVMLGSATPKAGELGFTVRLCDFGIAHWDKDDSPDLTAEMAVGTPRFMAPEQCTGIGEITPATDVYALGLVLFDLVTGSVPFSAQGSREMMRAQLEESPRRADEVTPSVSARTADFIERCLAKDAGHRPANAQRFVLEAQALLFDGPRESLHPPLPSDGSGEVLEVAYQWTLKASPEALWRYVSDTERVNRALGLPAVDWSFQEEEDGVSLFGAAVQVGVKVRWRERPYEWIEGQRLGVLREYQEGPLHWYVSSVELKPREEGGTTLVHRIWLKPSAAAWKPVVWVEVKQRLRGKLDRLYKRIGEVAASPEPAREDPFEGTPSLSKAARKRLDALGESLRAHGVARMTAESLIDALASLPDQAVARLRPIPLARRYAVPEGDMIDACLIGSSIGLLLPVWDVICPTCRVPTKVVDSLAAIRAHMSCEICRASFAVDAASSLELVFRAHPEIRNAELKTYCLGGPTHSPHAVAQVWLRAGERFRFEVRLEEGRYQLRTTKDEWRTSFRTFRGAAKHGELILHDGGSPPSLPALAEGPVQIVIENRCAQDRVIRLERASHKDDAFTAAMAAANPTFRRLFPQQTLAPETLVGMAAVSLLVTDVYAASVLYEQRGDAAMLGALNRHLDALSKLVAEAGGTVLKSVGHGVVAAFPRVEEAMSCALAIATMETDLPTVSAVHRGPAMMATVGGRLDYFGRAVVRVHGLLARAAAGQLIVSERVVEEGECEKLWRTRGFDAEVVATSNDLGAEMAVRLRRPGSTRSRPGSTIKD